MSIPVWVLLAFAGWTIFALAISVGIYRWSRVLTRRGALSDFGYVDDPGRSNFHRRAMRAHANCVENLPVYGAIVLAIVVSGAHSRTLDVLALVLIGARIVHTTVHLAFEQTNPVVALRSSFFLLQLVCMVWMGVQTALLAT